MATFHIFALRIQAGGAKRMLKSNTSCFIKRKQITISCGKMSQPMKSRSLEKWV